MEADFSGWATKAGLKCSDGRTITPDAFKHMDKVQVPLVWQHGHNDPANILGHAMLEARPDGVYAFGFFNDTPAGKNAKTLVEHKDINALSIFANQLVEKAKLVIHGMIREVSLVLAGANPGALIDNVNIQHSDGNIETLDDEVIIYTGLTLEHENMTTPPAKQGKTVQDIYDSLSEEQKNVVHFMISTALQASQTNSTAHSGTTEGTSVEGTPEKETPVAEDGKADDGKTNEGDLTHQEGKGEMTRNVFEQNGAKSEGDTKHVLSHEDVKGIVADAMKVGSLKQAVETYALAHGITNISVLFPDAQSIADRPEFDKRRTEWVAGVINGTHHTPFSRIKSLSADLTFDAARAKGYIKGSLKKEEFFGVSKRVTTPTTIYKKQQLDRDDIVDITDFDVVAWLKFEMRIMLDEELARAVLIGDGRDVSDPDKVKDPTGTVSEGAGIRSIANDHELYAATVYVNLTDANSSYQELVESILMARRLYKGSGSPTFYTTEDTLTRMLLTKDTQGRRLYNTQAELESTLRVSSIIPVEAMEGYGDLVGIVVNLSDYALGADKGGEVNMFDDFDIDYNQFKYLMETRVSGALTKIRSALVIRKTATANVLVDPITSPTFVTTTGVVTIPTQTGVVYKNADTSATLTAGAQTALSVGATLNVLAVPATNYYFATNADDQWSFTRP